MTGARPFSAAGTELLLSRLVDPQPGVDGTWTAVCPSCDGVLFIDPAHGVLRCEGRVS